MATERFSLGPTDRPGALRLGALLLRAAEREVEGAALTSVSFGPATTCYTRPPDVPLTLSDLAQRLAALRFRHRGPARGETCALGGPRLVTGADLALATGLDITNPEQEIVRLGPRAALELTLVVECGQGLRAAVGIGQGSYVPLPARFSPLVAGHLDWADDQLLLELTTDGQMTPGLLLRRATELLPDDLRERADRLATRAVAQRACPEAPGVPVTLGRVPRAVDWLAAGQAAFGELVGSVLGQEIERWFPLDGPSGRRRLAFAGLVIVPPTEPWSGAADEGRTWTGEVLVGVELHGERGQPVTRRRLRWAALPWLTPHGTFIVDGEDVVATTRVVPVGDGYRLQRAAGQLLDLARRTHDERLGAVIDGLDTNADAQDLLDRLGLSAAWLEWLRRGPTAQPVRGARPLSLIQASAEVRAQPHEARAVGLLADDGGWLEPLVEASPLARAGFAQLPAHAVGQAEPPWVLTGLEREAASTMRLLAPADGLVEALDDAALYLADQALALPALGWRALVSPGARVAAGEALGEGDAVLDGELALGRNLLVGWCDQWQGGLVLADRIANAELLTSTTTLRLIVPVSGEYVLTRSAVSDPRWLDQRGVVRQGAMVAAGEPLVARLWRHNNSDASQRAPASGDAWHVAAVREQTDARGALAQVTLTLVARHRPRPGDLLLTRHGSLGTLASVAADLPRLPDGRSLDLVVPGTPGPHRVEGTLGLVAQTLGQRIVVAPDHSPSPKEIGDLWHQAGLPAASDLHPLDARTGRPLPGDWSVGVLHGLCGG